MVFDIKGASTVSSSGMAASGLPSVNAKVSYKKNESAGMLPAGGFAPVVLLNGLDAGTSSATQANPMPVLMNVTDQATMPGAARYKLKSCFVLGNGFGDLSAERVYVRFNRLSCVDKNDHLILSQEVAGYVVDSDGKLGLRGKVVDRQGARLGKALLAGFAQGLSGALGNAQSSVTSNFSSGLSSSSISGSAALRQSGLSGAQSASQQLAEFYLKEAESIFPVVSIDTGRTGTIVFTNSVSLSWQTGDSQFVQQVQPN
jgi:conjugal transfer pilus assembly protein TraB